MNNMTRRLFLETTGSAIAVAAFSSTSSAAAISNTHEFSYPVLKVDAVSNLDRIYTREAVEKAILDTSDSLLVTVDARDSRINMSDIVGKVKKVYLKGDWVFVDGIFLNLPRTTELFESGLIPNMVLRPVLTGIVDPDGSPSIFNFLSFNQFSFYIKENASSWK